MKTKATWALVAIITFIFGQSLVFKFSGAEETVLIFSTIATWMRDVGFPQVFANHFEQIGGVTIATVELLAVLLLLTPRLRLYGAALSLSVISGAIFFHLFTPLGVDRVIDQYGNTDGGALFIMACVVAISSVLILALNVKRSQLERPSGAVATANYS